jgi:hypothetical protein
LDFFTGGNGGNGGASRWGIAFHLRIYCGRIDKVWLEYPSLDLFAPVQILLFGFFTGGNGGNGGASHGALLFTFGSIAEELKRCGWNILR